MFFRVIMEDVFDLKQSDYHKNTLVDYSFVRIRSKRKVSLTTMLPKFDRPK